MERGRERKKKRDKTMNMNYKTKLNGYMDGREDEKKKVH